MKIGRLVQSNIPSIFSNCAGHPDEFLRLLDPSYSNQTFKLNFPFCRETVSIRSTDNVRYWSQEYRLAGKTVRVCSQWIEGRHRGPFCQYLLSAGLLGPDEFEAAMNDLDLPGSRSTRSSKGAGRNSRFRGTAPGDAQNAVVRAILSKIGEESFDRHDWTKAKAHFDGRCAYCGGVDELEMDHAISINRTSLGEHRLGNIVPRCKACNRAKRHTDYVTYLGPDQERIDRITAYRKAKNYEPIGTNDDIRKLLAEAYEEAGNLIGRYIERITSGLARPSK
jgi:hypothetical protein